MNSQKKELLTYLERRFAGEYLLNEPLALHTWYRIGGPTDFFVYPKHLEDLVALLRYCKAIDFTNVYFIGEGANILASDGGYRGIIINLARYYNRIELKDNIVEASGGTLLKDLVLCCEKKNLGGLEYLSGIPGTVAGALIMNAGTHSGEIGDRVSEVSALNKHCESIILPRDQINFGYRSAPELQGKSLLGCKIKLYFEKEAILRERRLNQLQKRADKQPLKYPSCGSVFKRPKGYYVGKMVQELGLKGTRYGDAMISKKHGGFIVNLGDAKADDVMYLIKKIQEDVYNAYGVELEPEVRFLGF